MIELDESKYKSSNIVSIEEAARITEKLKQEGKKIGLCTGNFDLLHPGQINHLINAKNFCDILMVAISKKQDTVWIKKPGKGRPVYSHNLRAFMVGQLKPVDYVFFEEGGDSAIVLLIKPDFVIKGIDYAKEKNQGLIEQEKLLNSIGGKMIYTETEKLSTTEILRHIKENIEF